MKTKIQVSIDSTEIDAFSWSTWIQVKDFDLRSKQAPQEMWKK